MDSPFGVVWMLGTDRINECHRDFLKFSKHFEKEMTKGYAYVGNLVDASYTGAIRWLEWLGYEKGRTVLSPVGYELVLMVKKVAD